MKSKQPPIIIVTHNGLFHLDEIAAIALLAVFNKIKLDELNLIRTRDKVKIEQADIVLDVGGEYNSDYLRFDHHQMDNCTLSTAGLVWQWIKKNKNVSYPSIDKLIAAINKHDCGIEIMADFSLAHIVSSYNNEKTYDEAVQYSAFMKALNVVISFIASLKSSQDELLFTQRKIETATIFTFHNKYILELPAYCKGWQQFIHGESELAGITHVIWHIEHNNEWAVQIPAINNKSFKLGHPALKQDKKAIFVHQNGFVAFYKNKQHLLNAIK